MEQGRSLEILRALYDCHGVRWKVLWALLQSKHTVKELAEQLGVEQSSMSHHLQVLRKAGLVKFSGRKYKSYWLAKPTEIAGLFIDIQNLAK